MEIELLFSRWRLLDFLNFMKMSPNITNSTLTEVWPWHSRWTICKVIRKISFKFCKTYFFEGEQPKYLHIFFKYKPNTYCKWYIIYSLLYCTIYGLPNGILLIITGGILLNIWYCTALMEKVYKYYEIAAFLTECALILCLKTCF